MKKKKILKVISSRTSRLCHLSFRFHLGEQDNTDGRNLKHFLFVLHSILYIFPTYIFVFFQVHTEQKVVQAYRHCYINFACTELRNQPSIYQAVWSFLNLHFFPIITHRVYTRTVIADCLMTRQEYTECSSLIAWFYVSLYKWHDF